MNRRFAWIWGLATVAIASIVGVIAYGAGHSAAVVTTTGGDGRIIYPGYYGFGFGFFPFFGLLWVLLIGFLLFRLLFWRPWGRGPWGGYYHRHDDDHTHAPTTPRTPERKPEETAGV